jgi:hypothetical protein
VIKFSLICDNGHDFEAWFRDSGDYETQNRRGFLECPSCGSSHVSKALMAPNVATARKRDEVAVATGNAVQREVMAKLQRNGPRNPKKTGEDVGNVSRRKPARSTTARPIRAAFTARRRRTKFPASRRGRRNHAAARPARRHQLTGLSLFGALADHHVIDVHVARQPPLVGRTDCS